jgi:AcrR family transcriptional regulator
VLYHFPSKEALRKAVLDQLLYRWNEVLPRLLLAPSTSGEARFDSVLTELMGFFACEPDRARLLIRELLDRPLEMEEYLEGYIRPWLHVVVRALEEGKTSGVLQQELDPIAYTLHLTILALSSIATSVSWGTLLDKDPSKARKRYLAELIRIAKSSLFSHTTGTPDADQDPSHLHHSITTKTSHRPNQET